MQSGKAAHQTLRTGRGGMRGRTEAVASTTDVVGLPRPRPRALRAGHGSTPPLCWAEPRRQRPGDTRRAGKTLHRRWEPPIQLPGPTSTIFKRAHEKRGTLSLLPRAGGAPPAEARRPRLPRGPGCHEVKVSRKRGGTGVACAAVHTRRADADPAPRRRSTPDVPTQVRPLDGGA